MPSSADCAPTSGSSRDHYQPKDRFRLAWRASALGRPVPAAEVSCLAAQRECRLCGGEIALPAVADRLGAALRPCTANDSNAAVAVIRVREPKVRSAPRSYRSRPVC
jgi:hypothetical protein